MPEPVQDQTLGSFKSELEKLLSLSAADFGEAAERMSTYALSINNFFGEGRQRMQELMTSVADALPNINRLNGDIGDVAQTIEEIARASRRNVISNTESIEQMFIASKVTGQSVELLSNSFLNIGTSISMIPSQLEEATGYIRSIAGNTKEIMSDVVTNMDQMNRYQFEGGVKGLTKMAAQASMLRFDMSETFRLADKVLSPEGAIETASAFQRLGVAAGNLVDPFQLMNQSINDPSGLQNSLADVAKQFTYFDEKTKTFKINPQGVLTLKEMETQTGISAREMSKMGLAAAELDKRISAINAAGLKISNEEDKQFLSNIAQLGEKGTYEVTLKDGTKKELASLNQEEFDELIKQQKEAPQTMEGIARAQMNVSEIIKSDVTAIKNKLLYGITSAQQITGGLTTGARLVESTTGTFSKMGETKDVRMAAELFIKNFEKFGKDLTNPDKTSMDALYGLLKNMGLQFEDIEKSLGKNLTETLFKISERQTDRTTVEKKYSEGIKTLLKEMGVNLEELQKKYGDDFIKNFQKFSKPDTPKTMSEQKLSEGIKTLLKEMGVNLEELQKKYGDDFIKNFQKFSKPDTPKTMSEQKLSEVISLLSTQQMTTFGGKTKEEIVGTKKEKVSDMDVKLFDKMSAQNMEIIKSYLASQGGSIDNETLKEIAEKITLTRIPEGAKGINAPTSVATMSEVAVNGKIQIEISLPNNFNSLNTVEQNMLLDKIFNSDRFINTVANIAKEKNPTKPPVSVRY